MPAVIVEDNSERAVVTAQPPADARRFYVPVLDGIRAVAFGLVFVAHVGLDRIVPGGFGVTVFFFLSGYLITTLLRLEAERTGTRLRVFYIRRAFRILPPLYITIAFTLFLGAVHFLDSTGNWRACVSAILSSFNYFKLLAPQHGGMPTGLGVVWSLAIEEHFYLLFPVFYLVFVRRKLSANVQARLLLTRDVVLFMADYIGYVLHIQLMPDPPWTYIATDCRFDAIAWGCLLAVYHNPWFADRFPTFKKYGGCLASAGLAVIVASLLDRELAFRQTFRYTIQSVALYPVYFSTRWHPQARGPFGGSHGGPFAGLAGRLIHCI